jgi:3-hydroxyisobutyrate dehydrogenase-like beta-hydroxyacid dehydrogenase
MTMHRNERIGFIGVGFMGHGMARNIVEKGYPLTVLAHRRREAVDDLVGRGAREVKTTRELATSCDIVHLCVTGSPQVEELVRGPEGLLASLAPGSIVIDTSTSDPMSTLALAAELAQAGITLVDAPLGRTPKEAWAGTLDTMVGCDDDTFERIEPVLKTWAGRIVRIGRTGDGHKMKLINNFLSMGYAALYSEALALSQKAGITPDRFDSVIRGGRMDCGFYQTFMQYVLERDRDAHKFAIRNGLKDLRYVEGMANALGLANPVGSAAKNTFAMAVAAGRGDDYVPMLSDFVAALNGTSLAGDDTPAAPGVT